MRDHFEGLPLGANLPAQLLIPQVPPCSHERYALQGIYPYRHPQFLFQGSSQHMNPRSPMQQESQTMSQTALRVLSFEFVVVVKGFCQFSGGPKSTTAPLLRSTMTVLRHGISSPWENDPGTLNRSVPRHTRISFAFISGVSIWNIGKTV